MYIAFNMLHCGLGNNGGTCTILKCAEVIEGLGHRCDIIASVDNFTWFDHKKVIQYVPKNLDVLVATACTTVGHTLNCDVLKKVWYIRAHESWSNSEDVLKSYYLNSSIKNITNSYGLKNKLKEFDADAVVVHQGVDLEDWQDRQLRPKDKIRIGCLHQKKTTKRWKDFVKLAEILGSEKYEYVAFGIEQRNEEFLDSYVCSPTHWQLVNLYSSCHILFSPTELEGLHNVPMEAALCGCVIVCSDAPMNGMIYDYVFANKTGVIYPARDIFSAAKKIKNIDYNMVQCMQKYIKRFIGSREVNMEKFISHLEKI